MGSPCRVRNFLFQAEDGIRDDLVTGVQTCALPIFADPGRGAANGGVWRASAGVCDAAETCTGTSATCPADRSEERRVGKEGTGRSSRTDKNENEWTTRPITKCSIRG